MTTQYTEYQSTDGSAPTLSGTAGEFITVLTKCLIDGYGSKAAAGWAAEYTGTNKKVFRAPSGNRCRLRVADDGTGSASYARVIGYESMTNVDTGTGPFPTEAQQSGGLYWHKSNGANSTQRYWYVAANDRSIFILISTAGSATQHRHAYFFGDFKSLVTAGDAYNCMIVGATSSTSTTATGLIQGVTAIANTTAGNYIARTAAQTGGSVAAGRHMDTIKGTGSLGATFGTGGLPYPSNNLGGLSVCPMWINENSDLRGMMPGIWVPLHDKPLADLATDTGAGDLSGKSFRAVTPSSGTNAGQFLIETSNTLGTYS